LSRNGTGLITLHLDGLQCDQARGGNSKGPITTNLRILGSERHGVLSGGIFDKARHYFNGAVAGDRRRMRDTANREAAASSRSWASITCRGSTPRTRASATPGK